MIRRFPLGAVLLVLLPAAPLAAQAPASPAAPPAARAIVDQGLEAMGGRPALEAIETSRTVIVIDQPLAQGQLTADMSWDRDGDTYIVQTSQGRTTTMGARGPVAWAHTEAGGYQLLDERMARQMRTQAGMATMVLRLADEYPRMKTVGRADFAGRPCWKIALGEQKDKVHGARISNHHVFFDVASKRIAGLEYTENLNVGPVSVRVVYSDWQQTGELSFFRSIRMSRAALEAVTRITTLDLNGVSDAVFEIPEEVRQLAARKQESATTAPTSRPAGG